MGPKGCQCPWKARSSKRGWEEPWTAYPVPMSELFYSENSTGEQKTSDAAKGRHTEWFLFFPLFEREYIGGFAENYVKIKTVSFMQEKERNLVNKVTFCVLFTFLFRLVAL